MDRVFVCFIDLCSCSVLCCLRRGSLHSSDESGMYSNFIRVPICGPLKCYPSWHRNMWYKFLLKKKGCVAFRRLNICSRMRLICFLPYDLRWHQLDVRISYNIFFINSMELSKLSGEWRCSYYQDHLRAFYFTLTSRTSACSFSLYPLPSFSTY